MTTKAKAYEVAKQERQAHENAVLQSPAKKKIVVAGPGTGKTHLFKKILDGKGKTLTLTFVNALVEDLSLELCGLSDVKTLHSFARSVMKKATNRNIKVFPKLASVIKDDAKILLKEEIDFDHLFHNRKDENEYIEFYKKRKDYYDYYGFADIVFAVVKYFEQDKKRIPSLGQIVVDEFQDFNALEVSLIDLLAEKSPVLLAGDDDQALYESLKSANPNHIRTRYSDRTWGYHAFTLPYCSRCARVIVEATSDIITGATNDGYLASRINKPFLYFDDEKKDIDSCKNPYLVYSQMYDRKIPWFIQESIGDIANEVRDKFTVLIISPTKAKCRGIVNWLKDKGFQNIHFAEKKDTEEPNLLDGLKLLLEDRKCNLGWRIVAKNLLTSPQFEALLRTAASNNATPFSEFIETTHKRDVSQMLTILRAVRDGKETEENALADLLKRIGFDAFGTAKNYLKDEIESGVQRTSNPGIGKTLITATTIQSSKGLAADYVFITHFDDRYFIKDTDKSKISDQDICNFLVALTRTRKRVFLISSDTNKTPVFLKWIDRKRLFAMNGGD